VRHEQARQSFCNPEGATAVVHDEAEKRHAGRRGHLRAHRRGNNFPSRQAAKAPSAPRRKRRVYRTGRNQQFNAKATPETIEKIYKLANEKNVPLGELLRLALDALERAEASPSYKYKSCYDFLDALRLH
jgi:hypothetical protein